MSIKYRLVKRKDMSKGASEDAKLMYPQLVSNGRISFDDLCEEVAEQSSLTSGDIKNAVDRLIFCVSRHLRDGQSVDCGDLGSFSLTLRSSGAADADSYDVAVLMRKPKVVYHPGRKLREVQERAQFERIELPTEECDRPHVE